MPDQITSLVVGLGRIGLTDDLVFNDGTWSLDPSNCRTHVRTLSEDDRYALIGGVDPSAEARELLERFYGAPAWPDVADLPRTRPLDVLAVAAPTSLHVAAAIEAIDRVQPRVLVMEKPVGGSLDETRLLAESARGREVQVVVNYFRRFLPEVKQARVIIESEAAGGFRSGVVHYSHGLRRNGCHFVDLVRYWLGEVCDLRITDAGDGVTPSFALKVASGGWIDFIGVPGDALRVAEIRLAFDGGLLEYVRGGAQLAWMQRGPGPDPQAPAITPHWSADSSDPLRQRFVYDAVARFLDGEGELEGKIVDAMEVQRIIGAVLGDER